MKSQHEEGSHLFERVVPIDIGVAGLVDTRSYTGSSLACRVRVWRRPTGRALRKLNGQCHCQPIPIIVVSPVRTPWRTRGIGPRSYGTRNMETLWICTAQAPSVPSLGKRRNTTFITIIKIFDLEQNKLETSKDALWKQQNFNTENWKPCTLD